MSTSVTAGSSTALVAGPLNDAARAELDAALARLRAGRGVIVRSADLMGGLFSRFTRLGAARLGLSRAVQGKLGGIAEAALARAYDIAILGLPLHPAAGVRSPALARTAVLMSGATCGFAGLAGFIPDATFTTLTIMREIARIASEEGEELATEDARRACLEVFALQSGAGADPESELGYFSARMLMHGRPVMMLLSEVGSRYGLNLSRKFAAQAVPFAGAVAGAAINTAFLDHYRNLARAHFVIRRLERTHGAAGVRAASQIR